MPQSSTGEKWELFPGYFYTHDLPDRDADCLHGHRSCALSAATCSARVASEHADGALDTRHSIAGAYISDVSLSDGFADVMEPAGSLPAFQGARKYSIDFTDRRSRPSILTVFS